MLLSMHLTRKNTHGLDMYNVILTSHAAHLRERRLRELYHMICISQAELDGQMGAVADMKTVEDDSGWDAFEIKHKLVER
jgi:hypothetical protein